MNKTKLTLKKSLDKKPSFTATTKLTGRITFGFIMIVVAVVLIIFAIMFLIEQFVHLTEKSDAYYWVFSAVALAVGIVVGGILTASYTKMVKKVAKPYIDALQRVAEGDFATTIKDDGLLLKDTLIAENFNLMVKRLASVETLRESFISDFSHEFKTPIVSIEGFAKLLKDPTLTEEERNEYLDIIINESQRLVNLSQNVLMLTRLDDQVVEKEAFLLDEQLRQSVLLFDKILKDRNIQLDLTVDNVPLYSSPKLLSQVWVNLLSNAIKFSPDGSKIEIYVEVTDDTVIVSVKDHGCGMDEDTQKNVFNKFFQGDKSRSVEGNGLGLAIVQKIVKLLDGEIVVESEVGEGSTFTVLLPSETESSK